MQRLNNLATTLSYQQTAAKSDDDVVICSAVRTPLTKGKKGGLKDTAPEVMLSTVLREAANRGKINPKDINDIAFGNNLQPGAGEITGRMAMFLADFPDTTSIVAVNRLCSSGLEACAIIASKIKAGVIDVGVGAGVESMSLYDMNGSVNIDALSEKVFDHEKARVCLTPMGETSENVAEKFGIDRQKQDSMAVESHRKASIAQKNGLFDSEIVPVKTILKNKDGEEKEVTISKDDGVRAETTLESLGKLKPAFKKGGTTTAGNSSQVSDGAAAVLMARRSVAKKLGMPIIGRFVDYSVKGCDPLIMGIGPAVAIPALLEKTSKKINDIDIWEINEAFASQATYSVEKLGIDYKKLNPKGGAIALGHPLGCTGIFIFTQVPDKLQH
jgi:acetyl-CoA acyltransferase 1